jgi:hypothetical protein
MMRLRSKTILYEVRLRTDGRGVDLISDALPFGRLWYGEPNAIGYATHRSRSADAVIRVYDEAVLGGFTASGLRSTPSLLVGAPSDPAPKQRLASGA